MNPLGAGHDRIGTGMYDLTLLFGVVEVHRGVADCTTHDAKIHNDAPCAAHDAVNRP